MLDQDIEEFCAVLKYDQQIARYRFYNDMRWNLRVKEIVTANFNCLLKIFNDEINREFLDFIEGNGFHTEIRSMGKKFGLNVMDVYIEKGE